MSEKKVTPAGPATRRPIPITSYDQLKQWAEAFGRGGINLLILLGRPGLGKSRAFGEAVGPAALWVRGNATAAGLYRSLWLHRDAPVVIDDVDGVERDPASARLLKCVCETEPVKELCWGSQAAFLAAESIPRAFSTQSRVCIIANQWRGRAASVLAVEDRGTLVTFDPPPGEVHARAGTWFWGQDVFDWVGEHLHLAGGRLTFRQYTRAWELKAAGLGWQEALLHEWGVDEKTVVVARMRADPSFKYEEDRIREFLQAGHGNRATYYRHAGKLSPLQAVPRVRLGARPPKLPEWETAILLDE